MAGQQAEIRTMVEEANKMAKTIPPEMMPNVLVNACIGKKPQVAGVPNEMVTDQIPGAKGSTVKGLILSEANIVSIERYKSFGLALPVTEAAVRSAMKSNEQFDEKKHPEIAPAAFVTLNKTIKKHCEGWTGLRNEIILLGVSLNIFSKKFVSTGDDISEVIRNMPVVKRALTALKDYDGTFNWVEDDQTLKLGALSLIELLQQQVKLQQARTHTLVERLETFRGIMEKDVVPSVSRMNATLMDLEQSDERANMLNTMSELSKEIQSLDKQYKQLVGYAFTGAAAMLIFPVGILTWAITGGIFGSKAEKVRNTRKKCQQKKDDLAKQFKAEEYLAAFVTRVHDEVTKQTLIIDEALVGVKNMEVMWAAVARYIDDSADELAAITEVQKLLLFTRHLDSAVDSWREVQDITGVLNELFNKAEETARALGYLSAAEAKGLADAVLEGTNAANALGRKTEGGNHANS